MRGNKYRGTKVHYCWWCETAPSDAPGLHIVHDECGDYLVFCGNCGGSGPHYSTKIAAVRAWNAGPKRR